MANKSNDKTNDPSGNDDKSDAAGEARDDAKFAEEDLVAEPQQSSRLATLAALGAALLSLIALAGVAFLMSRPAAEPTAPVDDAGLAGLSARVTANADEVRQLGETLAALRQDVATLEQRAADLAARDSVAGSDIDALERGLNDLRAALDSVPARVASMERSLSTLRGISTGAEDAWLLAQAEYFLQAANAEIELGRNPATAATALEMADQRLLALGDPGLTDVRRTLSSELQSLRRLETGDLAGTAVTLASLSRVVDSLPVDPRLLTAASGGDEPTADTSDLSGWARARATLGNAFSGIIDVRRTDEEARPLIAPEAVYFLRANLGLQLQAARLALLRGERDLYEQSLDDAALWLREYYDVDSAPVASALETLEELRDTPVIPELPDISGSLRLLRQYIAFENAGRSSGQSSRQSSGQSAAPAAVTPPPAASGPAADPPSQPAPETEPQADAPDDPPDDGQPQ